MAISAAKDIATLVAEPLTEAAAQLTRALLTRQCPPTLRDTVIATLRTSLPTNQQAGFAVEEQRIQAALQTGSLTGQPALATPALQLLWAAHLVHAIGLGVTVPALPLWRQLVESDQAKQELMRHAMFIARDQFNPQTRLRWGLPGSMFYFDPVGNAINIDFLMSLIGGFEDTRSIIFHEIGHSKLTRSFTKRMVEIRTQMAALTQQGKKAKLSAAEYARLAGLRMQWDYLFAVFDEAENSPVNRYSINAGTRLQQDMGLSLNRVEIIVADADKHPLPQQMDADALFANVKRVIRLSLYKNNGLFSDDTAGWERMGVRREWITAAVQAGQPVLMPQQAFAELMELCGGLQGLEQLQPATLDRMRGPQWLEHATNDYADRRNAIIDNIWERYVLPILAPAIAEAEKQIRQAIQQNQSNQQPSPPSGQPTQNQPGQTQPGQGQPSKDQPGGGDSKTGAAELGATGSSGQGTAPSSSEGASGDREAEASSPSGDTSEKDDAQTQANKQPGPTTADGEQDQNVTADQQAPSAKNAPVTADTENNEELNVSPNGKMPRVPLPPKTPQEAEEEVRAKAKAQAGAADEAGDPSEKTDGKGESIKALLQESDAQARGENAAMTPQVPQGPRPARKTMLPKNARGGSSSGGMAKPKMGDWSNYQASVAQFMPEIRRARSLLVQLQERQAKKLERPIPVYELEPEGGDMSLHDMSRHEALALKIVAGQSISEDDAKLFAQLEEHKIPATIDIVFKTDGSGSMFLTREDDWPYAPMQTGLQTACILTEAAKKPRQRRGPEEGDINVWTVLWGNNPPLYITKPGDDPVHTARAIAGLDQDNGWGTRLAPAVVSVVEKLAGHKASPALLVGAVQIIVLSDGDIGDSEQAATAISALITGSKNVTYDVLTINPNGEQTQMGIMVRALQEKHGPGRVRLVPCTRPEQAHSAILVLLRDRMLNTIASEAVPYRERQRIFKKITSQLIL